MEAKETGNEYTSKKIEELKHRRRIYTKNLETVEENIKWWYDLQVKIIDGDLEDAVRAEAKRQTRKALRHIEKKLAEVDELRKQVTAVLYDNEILSYSAKIEFEDELGKRFENYSELLYGEN